MKFTPVTASIKFVKMRRELPVISKKFIEVWMLEWISLYYEINFTVGSELHSTENAIFDSEKLRNFAREYMQGT